METILAQTVNDWELIICDSYSGDGSWEFLQQFKSDKRISLRQVPRKGIYAGWNDCLRDVTARYVYMAPADDTMSPNCLERLVHPLERQPRLSLAACDFTEIDEQGNTTAPAPKSAVQEFYGEWLTRRSVRDGAAEALLHACFGPTWVTMTTVLFRRSLLEKTGLFPTQFGSVGDLAWAMRASLQSDTAYVPERLATWRIHATQSSGRVVNRAFLKQVISATRSVLGDERASIPATWKSTPGWKNIILRHRLAQLRHGFRLYRGALRENPLAFMMRAVSSAMEAPGWLLSQTVHGFPWMPESELDQQAHANLLLRTFGAIWPPRETDANWNPLKAAPSIP